MKQLRKISIKCKLRRIPNKIFLNLFFSNWHIFRQSSNVNFSSESYNRAQNDLKGMASKYVSELENDDGKRAAASAPMVLKLKH